jgi:hypothetical protein
VLKTTNKTILYFLAAGLFVPIFFQLSNGIFRIEKHYNSSLGTFTLLPIPISVIISYLAVIILGRFSRVRESLVIIFFTILTMVFSTITLCVMSGVYEKSKLILLIQFTLPMVALVVGQQFGNQPEAFKILTKVFFSILIIVIPIQILTTVLSGLSFLSPWLFIFSIYQHLQYVPVIFVSLFLFVLFSRDEVQKFCQFIPVLAILMGAYALFSSSMLAIGLLFAGMCGDIFHRFLKKKNHVSSILNLIMAVFGFFIVFVYINNSELLNDKLSREDTAIPKNMVERIFYWRFYISGITSEITTFIFGHPQAPDKSLYPSAHNYYLDFVYNFGLLALMPIISLVYFTVFKVFQHFKSIWLNPSLLSLASIVLYILLVDNSLKVGLRQPYPGIISFFLWGVLLAFLINEDKTQSLKFDRKFA